MEGRKVIQTFIDSSARDLAVPDASGQIGVQKDTGVIYIANGVTAGDWVEATSSSVTGTGTIGRIAAWNSTGTIGDTLISQTALESIMNNAWINVIYDGSDYDNLGGSPGTWVVASGDVIYAKYKTVGKTFFYQSVIENSTMAGTETTLLIKLPAGLGVPNSAIIHVGTAIYNASAAGEICDISIFDDGSFSWMRISRFPTPATPFDAGTNNQDLSVEATFEIA